MKLKHLSLIFVIFFAVISSAFANDNSFDYIEAGLTPDNALYGFDRLGETINLLFTINPIKKAEKRLEIANIPLGLKTKIITIVGVNY